MPTALAHGTLYIMGSKILSLSLHTCLCRDTLLQSLTSHHVLYRGGHGRDRKPTAAPRQILSPSKQHRTANASPPLAIPSVKEQSQSLSGFHLSDTGPSNKGEPHLDGGLCHVSFAAAAAMSFSLI